MIYTKESYSEVLEVLELLGEYYINKLPSKLVKLFEENKSEEYVTHIKSNVPLKDQKISEDTLAIIAILNLQYWCEDENEIRRLKEIYQKNEEKYQKELQEKYNRENLFKNKRKKNINNSTTEMIEYKSIPFYKKWINIIYNKLFKR